VVDMSAEFPARASVAALDYVCLPTLDLTSPAPMPFAALAARISCLPGPVLVHCGVGHARAAMMTAAILLCRGIARTAPEAVSMLKAARPRVRLRRSQRVFLETFATGLATS
jgi:protein-tyrosine phosphatase